MGKWSINVTRLVGQKKKELKAKANKKIKTLFVTILARTPVDTGQFKANWNISFGSPDTSFTLKMVNFEARNAQQLAKLAIMNMDKFPQVWLTNGLPYAQKLEHRYMTGKSGGMVRLSVIDFANAP